MVLITRTLSNGFDSTFLIIAAAGNQNHSNVDWKGIQPSIPMGARLLPAPAQVSWGFAQPGLDNLQGWRRHSLWGSHPSGGLLNKFLLNV